VVRLADAVCTGEPAWELGEGGIVGAGDTGLAGLGIPHDHLGEVLEDARREAEAAVASLDA
jgi:hypothetical protein